jgi:hypothetical protein
MLLTIKDVGALVEHTVWQRGKVVEVSPPYALIFFPSLANTEQGPHRKVLTSIEQLTRAKSMSDPELDLVAIGPAPAKKRAAKAAKAAKAKKPK